jgi:hypothetical protein
VQKRATVVEEVRWGYRQLRGGASDGLWRPTDAEKRRCLSWRRGDSEVAGGGGSEVAGGGEIRGGRRWGSRAGRLPMGGCGDAAALPFAGGRLRWRLWLPGEAQESGRAGVGENGCVGGAFFSRSGAVSGRFKLEMCAS